MLESDIESLQTLQKWERWWGFKSLRRAYTYESPFRYCKEGVKRTGIQCQLLEVTGGLWAILCDGRVELGFSPTGLLDQEDPAQILQNLASFELDKVARGMGTGDNAFLICDSDPWLGYFLVY